MSRWLDIAKRVVGNDTSLPNTLQKPAERVLSLHQEDFLQVSAGCWGGKLNDREPLPVTDMRHGFAINGNPRTWTGRIVSVEEWRQLSEWHRYGSNGRMRNGKTTKWEPRK